MKIDINFKIFFIYYTFIFFIKCVESKICPELKVLNPYKTRSSLIEGVAIPDSTIQILRGGTQTDASVSESVNYILIWDSSIQSVLYSFDLDLQISKIIYCKNKRKLIVAGMHKIIVIHPLTFAILEEHFVGGTTVYDVEDSPTLLLISRDNGNAFLYDMELKQTIETFPYSVEGYNGFTWSQIIKTKDYNLFINALLMIFDRDNNNQFITILATENNDDMSSRVTSIQGTNLIATSNWKHIILLGEIYNDSGILKYRLIDKYEDDPTLRFTDLHYMQRGEEQFVMGPLARNDANSNYFKGATVLKLIKTQNLNQISYSFAVQEKWMYRRWRKDMEFFLYDESTYRGHSISEYEHYQFEFLERDEAQCDFDEDGVIDSYCRFTKTISHWCWDLQSGVFLIGNTGDYFVLVNDKVKGYQIKDFNQTEILRFSYPQLIDKSYFSIQRVQQQNIETSDIPYDTFILKMGWGYTDYSELESTHNTTAGIYLYSIRDDPINKIPLDSNSFMNAFNLIDYLNPSSNTEKYKCQTTIVASYTYKNYLYVCYAFRMPTSTTNYNEETQDIKMTQQYFVYHQKECFQLQYSLTNGTNAAVKNFYQLKLKTPIDYTQQSSQYSTFNCFPHFLTQQLVCKNSQGQIEMWSLDSFTLTSVYNIPNCVGEYDIKPHQQNRLFVACQSSILVFSLDTFKAYTFFETSTAVPSYLQIHDDIFVLALSTLEILVYDFSNFPSTAFDDSNLMSYAKLVFQYQDPQDCCVILALDYHPESKHLLFSSQLQITMIDIGPCIENPNDCIQCEMEAYFSYDSSFTLLKQKWKRSSWPTIGEGSFFANSKFLDTGKGTQSDPYLSDQSVMQFYYRTKSYILNIKNFKSITLNLYFDVSQPQYQSNHLIDWEHPNTIVNFYPWVKEQSSSTSTDKIKVVILSYEQFSISVTNWSAIYMQNILLICPKCSDISITFSSSGTVNLKDIQASMSMVDLNNSQQLPNLFINSKEVEMFTLEGQFIGNSNPTKFNTIPYFQFSSCNYVMLKNLEFSNISNQESIIYSSKSKLILENIVFQQLNTCNSTGIRTKFTLLPFQSIEAKNITFQNNDFCDVCIFQNEESSDGIAYTMNFSEINIISNRFASYTTTSVVFLKVSLVSFFITTQILNISDVNFKKNTGSTDSSIYYVELTKLATVIFSNVFLNDEALFGLTYCQQINDLHFKTIQFINSQVSDSTEIYEQNPNDVFLRFEQILIRVYSVDNVSIDDMKMKGFLISGDVAVQLEECGVIDLNAIWLRKCSFEQSQFCEISNHNSAITQFSLKNSQFYDLSFSTLLSQIQVGLLSLKSDKGATMIELDSVKFKRNFLSVNYNTQKKSALSISVENSISQMKITNCIFSNKPAHSIIGDLYLNVMTLTVKETSFSQFFSEDISSTNLKDIKTKGSFLTIQAQDIIFQENSFSNAISNEGAIQILPNNNALSVLFSNCIFNNLYASSSGTALYLSTNTAPINLSITSSTFMNMWLSPDTSTFTKSHIYCGASSLFLNEISFQNVSLTDIGILDQSTPSFLIYSSNPTIFSFINSDIKRIESTDMNAGLLYKYMTAQNIFSSSLIKTDQSKTLLIQSVSIQGEALLLKFKNADSNTIFPSFLHVTNSNAVKVSSLLINNLVANNNGGIVLLSGKCTGSYENITLSNVSSQSYLSQTRRQLEQLSSFKTIQSQIGRATGLLNCLSSSCSYVNIQAICDISKSSCQGVVINQQGASFSLTNSKFKNYYSDPTLKQNGTAILIVDAGTNVLIQNSEFNLLYSSSSGGAVYIYQSSSAIDIPFLTIYNNTFEKCVSENIGGAIALESNILYSPSKLQLTFNKFTQNTAKIGGAIYFRNHYPSQQSIATNNFQMNKGQMGSALFSTPTKIKIMLSDIPSKSIESSSYSKTDLYLYHGSGLKLPTLSFMLLFTDENGQDQEIDISLLSSTSEILEMTLETLSGEPASTEEFSAVGILTSMFNSTNNSLQFTNIDLYGEEFSKLILKITSPYIKETIIENKNNQTFSYSPYSYKILIDFRECSIYEIITTHSIPSLSVKVKKCSVCPDLSFSNNKEVCEQCPIGATCTKEEDMDVQYGYWRSKLTSKNILSCSSGFDGCIGGKGVFNEICKEGYIGPLCSQCDLFNERGAGKFTRSGRINCEKCQFSFLNSIVFLGTIFVSIFLTLRAIQSNSNFIKAKVIIFPFFYVCLTLFQDFSKIHENIQVQEDKGY